MVGRPIDGQKSGLVAIKHKQPVGGTEPNQAIGRLEQATALAEVASRGFDMMEMKVGGRSTLLRGIDVEQPVAKRCQPYPALPILKDVIDGCALTGIRGGSKVFVMNNTKRRSFIRFRFEHIDAMVTCAHPDAVAAVLVERIDIVWYGLTGVADELAVCGNMTKQPALRIVNRQAARPLVGGFAPPCPESLPVVDHQSTRSILFQLVQEFELLRAEDQITESDLVDIPPEIVLLIDKAVAHIETDGSTQAVLIRIGLLQTVVLRVVVGQWQIFAWLHPHRAIIVLDHQLIGSGGGPDGTADV